MESDGVGDHNADKRSVTSSAADETELEEERRVSPRNTTPEQTTPQPKPAQVTTE